MFVCWLVGWLVCLVFVCLFKFDSKCVQIVTGRMHLSFVGLVGATLPHDMTQLFSLRMCVYCCLVALVQTGFHLISQYLHVYQKYSYNLYSMSILEDS